eukprot:740450-Karenia_brevis.AAC.1
MSELNRADKPSRLHMTQNDYKQEARLKFLKSRKLGRHRQSALTPLPDHVAQQPNISFSQKSLNSAGCQVAE